MSHIRESLGWRYWWRMLAISGLLLSSLALLYLSAGNTSDGERLVAEAESLATLNAELRQSQLEYLHRVGLPADNDPVMRVVLETDAREWRVREQGFESQHWGAIGTAYSTIILGVVIGIVITNVYNHRWM